MSVNDQAKKRQRPLLLRQLPLPGVTPLPEMLTPELQVVVSLFPGVGLLDRGFECGDGVIR